MYCWRTAPKTATSEASVTILVGSSAYGCERRVALASASLIATNAARALSFHCTVLVLSLDPIRRALRGCIMSVPPGMKQR